MTQGVTSRAKKAAKIALFKILKEREIPDSVVAHLLGVLGIGYESNKEPMKNVFISRFMNGCAGSFCVSIDFDNRRDDRIDLSKEATLELLALCEEFNIPVTWAICGVTATKERDTFESILNSKVKHEIAVHTFDHVDFSSSSCTEELARSQVLRTVSLLPPGSGRATFIFPWNRTGHFKVLRELGFIAYRGREKKLAYPSKDNGLWNIHPLFYLYERNYNYANVLKALLDLTISREAPFHLWFHPWNLEVAGDVSRYINDTIRPLFEYVDLKRRDGKLWVCTLGELANYCEAKSRAKIDYTEKNRSMDISVECYVDDSRFNKKPVLTLGVKVPDGVTKFKASFSGKFMDEEKLMSKRPIRGWQVLYLNLLFDEPLKTIAIEFLDGT